MSQPENLPRQLTSFVGREAELERVLASLDDPDCRLLTLVGPGGAGKTRLALEAAQRRADSFTDGVFWIALQPEPSVNTLVTTIADALSLALSGPDEPRRQLLNYLQDKTALLVLDSFEAAIDGAGLIHDILHGAPGVKVLVTSREFLKLQQAWHFPIAGLAMPLSTQQEGWASFEAVQLFVQRARRVRPQFDVKTVGQDVIRLCRQVEGLPLAIELAAAWLKTLTCAEIVAEIQRNLDLLATTWKDVAERHRSFRAVFDTSWQRLSPAEQKAFMKLSIFRGGFRRQAASVVARATLPILSALVDKSLLRWEPHERRYQMHELLRRFAAGKLRQTTSDEPNVQEQHARYYARFLQERAPALRGGRQREALAEIGSERDNVRLAWQWAVDRQQAMIIADVVEPLNQFYDFRGHYLEGIQAFNEGVDALRTAPESRDAQRALARLHVYLGGLYLRVGRIEEAEQALLRCRELYEQLGISPLPGYASDPAILRGIIASVRGRFDETARFGRRALQTAQATDHPTNEQMAYYLLARAALQQGQLDEARAHIHKSYALTKKTGDRWFMAYCLNELGNVALDLGDEKAATQYYNASFEIRSEFEDPEGMAVALNHLAAVASQTGAYGQSDRQYRESLAISREISNRGSATLALQGLAQNAAARSEEDRARSYLQEALQLVREGRFTSLFLSLLVDIAGLVAGTDASRATSLLALVASHAGSEPQSRRRAREQLQQIRGRGESPEPALAADVAWPDLERLATRLQADLETARLPAATAGDSFSDSEASKAKRGVAKLLEPLTDREAQVLALLAGGLSNREIADRLVLAVGTVKYYTSEIYGKLGVRNRVEAVRRARALDLLDDVQD